MEKSDRESMHLDILKGLSVYFDSPFVADIQETALRHPRLTLGHALNRNQMTSKTWLVDKLHGATGGQLGRVCILGGWYGVLGAMLLHDPRFAVERVCSVDMDPTCEDIAKSLNRTHVEAGKFEFRLANMYEIDFPKSEFDLIVNTSCEHLETIDRWFERIPAGTLLTLQSNNYFGIDGHVNCVENIGQFKQQVPLSQTLFEGELELKKYTRFMLIGRR
ncbi:MAG: methyltransferase domain-containing protein [Hyphomicrobiaceae bacterium]|nr:methyltransferase domain-containing protein [Hyphomicrobiaceae bacterium]